MNEDLETSAPTTEDSIVEDVKRSFQEKAEDEDEAEDEEEVPLPTRSDLGLLKAIDTLRRGFISRSVEEWGLLARVDAVVQSVTKSDLKQTTLGDFFSL